MAKIEGLEIGAEEEQRTLLVLRVAQLTDAVLKKGGKRGGEMEDISKQPNANVVVDGTDQVALIVLCGFGGGCVVALHFVCIGFFNAFLRGNSGKWGYHGYGIALFSITMGEKRNDLDSIRSSTLASSGGCTDWIESLPGRGSSLWEVGISCSKLLMTRETCGKHDFLGKGLEFKLGNNGVLFITIPFRRYKVGSSVQKDGVKETVFNSQ